LGKRNLSYFFLENSLRKKGDFFFLFLEKKEAKKTAAVVVKAKNQCLRLKKNKSQLKKIAELK